MCVLLFQFIFFSLRFPFPLVCLRVCPSLPEVTQARRRALQFVLRASRGPAETRGLPLCEEMIFSVLRRTLQIISSNLSNGPETLLPLSCNGDRWLAVQTGAIQTPQRRGEETAARSQTRAHTHIHKHLHKMPLHWWPMWLRVIVSSQAVVLVVILNDHSQRGVLTICPFKGKMIPLYRLTPEHPAATTAPAAATKATTSISGWDNTTFNVSAIKRWLITRLSIWPTRGLTTSVLYYVPFSPGKMCRSCIAKMKLFLREHAR